MDTTTAMPDRRTAAHSALTPEDRTRRARLAASSRWAKHDRHKGTQPARTAFLARFEAEVDPEGQLPAAERATRAEHAMRAYFQRMAMDRERKRRAQAS